MISSTEIVNQALLMLGENRVTALDEESTFGVLATSFYASSRLFVLQDIKPPFARARMAAPAHVVTPDPVGDLDYEYPLPAGSCCLLGVGSSYREYISWEVEGGSVLTDQPIEWMRYVRGDDTVDARMDAPFIKALVVYLAHEFAYAVMGDKNRANELMDMYTMRANDARAIYGLAASTQEFSNDQLSARR